MGFYNIYILTIIVRQKNFKYLFLVTRMYMYITIRDLELLTINFKTVPMGISTARTKALQCLERTVEDIFLNSVQQSAPSAIRTRFPRLC